MAHITTWNKKYGKDFESLNREWIETFFGANTIEPIDNAVLTDTQKTVIDKGGQVFFAVENEKVLGCCALINHGQLKYEISKLAVSPAAQGKGIASALFDEILEYSKKINAKKLIIESNTKLKPAIHLYQKYGFEKVDNFTSTYKRVDIYFEKTLN
ncbi:MAG: GNAT family N-acetyltransferase [Salinivirgaceae bacterium]|nr:GNAT family N-acetyltransferase [Salinivirgaceae bacterium]